MTFADLRALHAIIGDALDDIQHCYSIAGDQGRQASANYASPPPSPSIAVPPTIPTKPTFLSSPSHPSPSLVYPSLDFPSLNSPYDPSSPAEALTAHPTVAAAINRIVAACGQIAMGVQTPFFSLCDAVMGYHLPSCMRLLETTHTVEILRDAGSGGLHVDRIAEMNGMDAGKLGHILRLLATHHITREVSPDVFANNRVSGCMDSGKPSKQLIRSPGTKYDDTNGISAFVGLCTDELFKSSAFLTEAYYLDASTKYSREPTHAPFNFAFETTRGFFGWLEDGGTEEGGGGGSKVNGKDGGNKHRLERFGKAMTGTGSWEAPGAVLTGFDWSSLAPGGTVVDVGGGIGSTSMVLALAGECEGLNFIVQDRDVVVKMGEKAWRSRYPEFLDSGRVKFQVHDFFTPQPIKDASVFLLRVVLHDWPDAFARRILLRLREAAREPGWRVCKRPVRISGEASPRGLGVVEEDGGEEKKWDEGTKLVMADFVLPLACVDEFGSGEEAGPLGQPGEGVEGVERMLAPAPLLPNLGKASAHAYWMDLTMQVIFNGQERTLREITALALSAGWKVMKVTRPAGSLFGHIVAVPVPIPVRGRARAGSGSAFLDVGRGLGGGILGRMAAGKLNEEMEMEMGVGEQEMVEAASSRSGTPTFGSRIDLPSFEDAFARFGGRSGAVRGRGASVGFKGSRRSGRGGVVEMTNSVGRGEGLEKERPGALKPALLPVTVVPKKKGKMPSPLSVYPPPPSPTRTRQSPTSPIFNRQITPTSPTFNRDRQTPPLPQFSRQPLASPLALPSHRQSPLPSPRRPSQPPLAPFPVPTFGRPPVPRRLSQATLAPQVHGTHRKRSGTVVGFGVGGGIGMGALGAGTGEPDIGEEEWKGCAGGNGSVLEAAAKIELRLPKGGY